MPSFMLMLISGLFFAGATYLMWLSFAGPPKRFKDWHRAAPSVKIAGRAFLLIFAVLASLIGVAVISTGKRTGQKALAKRAVEILRYYDLNKNRQIDLPAECSRKLRSGMLTVCHEALFRQADADSSQAISLQELEAHLFAHYDLNADSVISREEDLKIDYREGAY